LLGTIIVAGFVAILGGMLFAFIGVSQILTMREDLSRITDNASRLNSLSKDLLITENLFQTFGEWRECRTELEKDIVAFVESAHARRYLKTKEGQKQETNTRRLLKLIGPKMDAVENLTLYFIQRNPAFPSGLLDASKGADATLKNEDIRTIKSFSLYIGDLLSVRVSNLSAFMIAKSQGELRLVFFALNGTALVIFLVIMVVLRALASAQILNEENTEYLESILTAIYDISGQGFLTYDPTLRVDTSISRQSARLLGQDPGNRHIEELLWEDQVAREDFRQGMALVFSGKAKPEVVFDLFEKEVTAGERYLRINFRYLSPKRIMLALTDMSREHALREMLKNEEHRKTLILKVVSNRLDFAAFIHEANALFAVLGDSAATTPRASDLEALMRQVHTLKGNAGFFGFTDTAEAAHEFEYHISDAQVLGLEIEVPQYRDALRSRFNAELLHITDFLGESWLGDLDTIHIPRPVFLDLERELSVRCPGEKALIQRFRSFRSVPFRDLFARYPSMIADLAEKNGKLINQTSIEGGDFRVLPDSFETLMAAFVHVIRNIVDHGIETPAERELASKDRFGNVTIRLEKGDGLIRIHASDDGRGIRLDDLERKAREKGLIKANQNADAETLFGFLLTPGLSTASKVTMLSGRGAGLPAVYEAVASYGGTMKITSKAGVSTDFDIVIPTKKGKK
jgi:two-component system chemotaxis sensor kinase CheA